MSTLLAPEDGHGHRQRVRQLVLNPEITAPARPHSTWCLQHQHGACPSARRPLQHPHGAWPSARRPLSTSSPTARAARLARLHKTDDARCASRSAHQDRRRTPHVPFGTTQEEFSFAFHRQVLLLPALHHHFRHDMQDDAQTRRRRTTRLRVHVDMATRRRSAKARRASCSQWPRGEPTSYETQLRWLKVTKTYQRKTTKLTKITRNYQNLPSFCLAQMRVFRYRFRKPSSVCVAL